jgi:hypothetical protein
VPVTSRTCQDADVCTPERARASSPLVTADLPLTYPLTHARNSTPATSQICSLAPERTVAVVTIEDFPPRYCELASPSRSRQRSIFCAVKPSVLAMTSPTSLRHRPRRSATISPTQWSTEPVRLGLDRSL